MLHAQGGHHGSDPEVATAGFGGKSRRLCSGLCVPQEDATPRYLRQQSAPGAAGLPVSESAAWHTAVAPLVPPGVREGSWHTCDIRTSHIHRGISTYECHILFPFCPISFQRPPPKKRLEGSGGDRACAYLIFVYFTCLIIKVFFTMFESWRMMVSKQNRKNSHAMPLATSNALPGPSRLSSSQSVMRNHW